MFDEQYFYQGPKIEAYISLSIAQARNFADTRKTTDVSTADDIIISLNLWN
jgi:hypothetical protein